MSAKHITNKTALVTGASRGIGAGISKILAGAGYNLILVCKKNERMLNKIASDIHSHLDTEVLTLVGDVSDEYFVNEIKTSARMIFGQVDVLVNNAGIWQSGLVTETSLDTWNELVKTNLTGTFLMCRGIAPMMIEKKSGSIINISSIWGVHGASCESAYSATKGGVNAFTQALAMELAPSGIRVNAIAPGVIDTEMNSSYTKDELQDLQERIPLGRIGTPKDIGRTILSIINSPYMTGQIITVDGGFLQ